MATANNQLKPDVLALLAASEVFGLLPGEALATLAAAGRIEAYETSTLVYAGGTAHWSGCASCSAAASSSAQAA